MTILDGTATAQWAERGLLGGLLWQMELPLPPLLAEEFSLERHRDIWRAYLSLEARGMGRDIGLVADATDRAIWSRTDAATFLTILWDETWSVTYLDEYAKAVRQHATQRSIHDLGVELQRQGLTPDEIDDRLRAMPGPIAPALTRYRDGWAMIKDRWGASHIATGLRPLDTIVDGLAPGKLVALGGRTSHGKTAFMIDRALHFARRNVTVEMISLEDPLSSVTARLLANITGYVSRTIVHGNVGAEDVVVLEDAVALLDSLPLRVTTAESLRSLDLRAILGVVRRSEAQVIMVDYVQKISTGDHSRAYGIERILNEFHQAAIQQNAIIWLNVQLNRDIETRKETKGRAPGPQLSDLRDSGASEIVPRQVWLLYWPRGAWLAQGGAGEPPDPNKILVRVAKNSDGATGDAWIRWSPGNGRFYDADPDDTAPTWVTE